MFLVLIVSPVIAYVCVKTCCKRKPRKPISRELVDEFHDL